MVQLPLIVTTVTNGTTWQQNNLFAINLSIKNVDILILIFWYFDIWNFDSKGNQKPSTYIQFVFVVLLKIFLYPSALPFLVLSWPFHTPFFTLPAYVRGSCHELLKFVIKLTLSWDLVASTYTLNPSNTIAPCIIFTTIPYHMTFPPPSSPSFSSILKISNTYSSLFLFVFRKSWWT